MPANNKAQARVPSALAEIRETLARPLVGRKHAQVVPQARVLANNRAQARVPSALAENTGDASQALMRGLCRQALVLANNRTQAHVPVAKCYKS